MRGNIYIMRMRSENMNIPLVDLKRQYRALRQELDREVLGVMERTSFILGETVQQFEQEFAAYCEAKYCIGLNSGTDALQLSLTALGIGPGDEVITTPYTYIATLFAILRTGASVKLVDVEPRTFTIDPTQIRANFTPKTKAIVPVHLYGHPADLRQINELAEPEQIAVIEDACQAHGARAHGKRVGSAGTAAAFSFYPSKNLGAYGDGGALVTNDRSLYEQMLVLRNQGDRSKYDHITRGFNSRLDAMQAAILRVKLKHLDAWNAQRRKHAQRYTELLGDVVTCPMPAAWASPVYHLYTIRTRKRQQVQEHLRANGIGSGVYYGKLCHLQPAFDDLGHLGYSTAQFPIGTRACAENLALPMFPELSEAEIRDVATQVRAALSEHA